MHRDLLGALAIWTFSLPGLLFSVLLTVLKFRADHLCDAAGLSACSGGLFGCSLVFHDAWAKVWDLPLTIYAAAFYLVAAVLAALMLLNPVRLRATIRPIFVPLAWAGVAVVVALGGYAALHLGTLCLYCAYLYLTNVGLLLAVQLMHPHGALAGARPLLRRSETTVVLAVAALGFVTAVMAQRTFYLLAAADGDPHALDPCVTRLNELEPSGIGVRGPALPRLGVALFLDLDCPHCREDFAVWRRLIAEENEAGAGIELRVYQFPRDGCDTSGRTLDAHGSCNAARALLCLTQGLSAPELALAYVDRLFALQDQAAPHFTSARLAEVARSLGVDADPGRPAADDPLFSCMQSPATTATLHRHLRLAQDVAGLVAPPGALLIPLTGGQPTGRAMQIHGRKPRATLAAWIYDALTSPDALSTKTP